MSNYFYLSSNLQHLMPILVLLAFSAVFSTIDFTRENVENNVVKSPLNHGLRWTFVCSLSPLRYNPFALTWGSSL
jgi:hypothetical protein